MKDNVGLVLRALSQGFEKGSAGTVTLSAAAHQEVCRMANTASDDEVLVLVVAFAELGTDLCSRPESEAAGIDVLRIAASMSHRIRHAESTASAEASARLFLGSRPPGRVADAQKSTGMSMLQLRVGQGQSVDSADRK